ncbi:MAG: SCO family protein [Nocardioidaceae bacterium]|nr:SCO family protein [Nocardioidaceae bacterium]
MADARRRLLGAAAVLTAAALLGGCGSSGSSGDGPAAVIQTGDNHGYHGRFLELPYAVPDVALKDTEGTPLSLAKDTATPVKIVFWGYSNCPDVCQIVMSTVASALTRLDEQQKKQVEVVFVTTDPARDTGPALRRYLDRFSEEPFTGLTGSLPRIVAAGKPMGVYVDKGQKLGSGGYEVVHSDYLYGASGTDVRLIWDRTVSPADLAADIIKLLKS